MGKCDLCNQENRTLHNVNLRSYDEVQYLQICVKCLKKIYKRNENNSIKANLE